MINNFRDQTTSDVFHGHDTKAARKIPKNIWRIASRKLDLLNASHAINDLRVPPGNRLESLKGTLEGYYSIRVNDQFRIVFRWADMNPKDVFITDYH